MRLMEKVRKLQAQRKADLNQTRGQVKVLASTTGFRKTSKSRSPTRHSKPSELELKSIQNNLDIETKKLSTLKYDVEVLKKTFNQG